MMQPTSRAAPVLDGILVIKHPSFDHFLLSLWEGGPRVVIARLADFIACPGAHTQYHHAV